MDGKRPSGLEGAALVSFVESAGGSETVSTLLTPILLLINQYRGPVRGNFRLPLS